MSRTKPEKREGGAARRRNLTFALLGLLALLLVVPKVVSHALFTTTSRNTGSVGAALDWTPPTVALTNPGDAIRGSVTLAATASDAETGVANVVIMYAPSASTTWTTICTDTTAPYSCALNTATLPEDYFDLRAVATDNSGYSAESLIEGVLVDNTAPTGSLNAIASPMAGVVTLGATATDAGSGVASVTIQRAPTGGTTFTTICTDIDLPYSCRFDTTQVPDGFYDFRAIVTDAAGNTTTTAKVTNRAVLNTGVSTVSVDDPGSYLRGTASLAANANATLGVASVKLQYQKTDTTTWVDICTDTTSPYGCSWNTASVVDGTYSFRALMTDAAGTVTTSATVGPAQVDNTVVRGYDVQTASGGSLGKISTGDAITLTYSRSIKLTSILAGWDGTARAVQVRVRDGVGLGLTGTDDTADVWTTTAFNTAINLGSVDLKGNFLKNNKTVAFNATMTSATTTVNGISATTITLTLGTQSSGNASSLRTSTTPASMVWSPSALATDTIGNPVSTAPVTESGATKDRDF